MNWHSQFISTVREWGGLEEGRERERERKFILLWAFCLRPPVASAAAVVSTHNLYLNHNTSSYGKQVAHRCVLGVIFSLTYDGVSL